MTSDVIFCSPPKNLVAQRECLASKFGLQKIVLQKKNSIQLKLLKNSHEVMVDNCNKSRAVLQVTAREVMTLFFRDQHHSGPHRMISRDRCPEK